MAGAVTRIERRAAPRRAAAAYGFEYRGQLRPGTAVLVLNLSSFGALLESGLPCRPGSRTELHLDSPDGRRHSTTGAVLRCWVTSVAPLRFRSAVRFEKETDLFGYTEGG